MGTKDAGSVISFLPLDPSQFSSLRLEGLFHTVCQLRKDRVGLTIDPKDGKLSGDSNFALSKLPCSQTREPRFETLKSSNSHKSWIFKGVEPTEAQGPRASRSPPTGNALLFP
ncbi:hypothetical protein STEG23_011240, partial [Scotinomys teguina]